jgi:hypothetical protein
VTPHHIEFRAHGGDDSEENLATACAWCHLHGIHEGRLAARPPASAIRWRIGRKGLLWVDGRRLCPQPSTDGEASAVDDGRQRDPRCAAVLSGFPDPGPERAQRRVSR